jgi:hypothetical protein
MTLFRITIQSKRPWFDDKGGRIFKRFISDLFVDPATDRNDIRKAIAYDIQRKHDNFPILVALTSQVFEFKDGIKPVGHFAILDFDGVDLASTISTLEYVISAHDLKCRSMIVESDHGYHIYCFKIMEFETLTKIMDDPTVMKYHDPMHRKISEAQGWASVRIIPMKFGRYNNLRVVYECGEAVEERESEIYKFVRKFID